MELPSRKGRFRLQGMASEGCMFKLQLTNEVSTIHFLDLWVQDGDTVTIRGNSKYSFDWVVTSTNPMQQEQTAYNDAAKKYIGEIARQDTLIWKLTVRQHMASGSQAQRLKDSIAIANRSRDSLYAQVGAKTVCRVETALFGRRESEETVALCRIFTKPCVWIRQPEA